MARKLAAVVFSMGCLHASSTLALGLGEISLDSFLNEPLKAKVDLLNTGGLHEDQIRIRLATKDDFKKMGIDRAYFLTNISFEVDIDASGRGRIILTSEDPVLEPYLDFIVEARWPSGRLLREYTVLVDPPVFDSSNPVLSASERVEAVEGIPAPAKKKTVATSSGTRVDVGSKSAMAAGEMPDRNYSASTASMPSAGSRYMINRDDTLWKIAQTAKPEGVSIHQTMLDIQRLNPDAFIDGNINRIKAGYIVYLPDSGDISSADAAEAVAEVRQQNDDWRRDVESQPQGSSGPSLVISAAPKDETGARDAAGEGQQASASGTDQAADLEGLAKAELEQAELEDRLASMAQQVQTLQRIVDLKDDQIAALQNALADEDQPAGAAVDGESDSSADAGADMQAAESSDTGDGWGAVDDDADRDYGSDGFSASDDSVADGDDDRAAESGQSQTAAEDAAQAAIDAKPQAAQSSAEEAAAEQAPAAPVAATPSQEVDGSSGYLKYLAGGGVAVLLGWFFVRRRRAGDEEEYEDHVAVAESAAEDVFADVELQDHELVLDEPEDLEEELAGDLELTQELPEAGDDLFDDKQETRGYGGRKHDEYASDVDAGDALAEADIYIAYGRYPQAADLLRNAIATEPSNPAYRLKLLEMYSEMNDRDSAMAELSEIRMLGDTLAEARAEDIVSKIGVGGPPPAADLSNDVTAVNLDPVSLAAEATDLGDLSAATEADLNDLTLDTGEVLEADFAGLEIEQPESAVSVEDDLDLSADFEPSVSEELAKEDLVIAAETNGYSTKLDLARAYLDMGDDEGARQILEEIAGEGSEELKSEAQALLARID